MGNYPMMSFISFSVGLYFLWIWVSDFQATEKKRNSLPGTSSSSMAAVLVAIIGSILLIGLITLGEFGFGIAKEQSEIPFYFIFAMMGASITEEVIFRGYLIIENRGKIILWLSALFFSVIFAILHPYLWNNIYESPSGLQHIIGLRIDVSPYSLYSTSSIVILSLWFYYIRFCRWNVTRSLLPCFIAHLSANLTVYIIKLLLGFVKI